MLRIFYCNSVFFFDILGIDNYCSITMTIVYGEVINAMNTVLGITVLASYWCPLYAAPLVP